MLSEQSLWVRLDLKAVNSILERTVGDLCSIVLPENIKKGEATERRNIGSE